MLNCYEKDSGQMVNKNKKPFSLVCPLLTIFDKRSKRPWVYRKLRSMRNTLVHSPWWVEGKKKASTISKRRFGGNCKVGKTNSCRKLEGRY